MKKYLLTVILTVGTVMAAAENWPQWRGPAFNGSSAEKNLPDAWSKTNVAWSVSLPGPSAATPVIWEDHVFISTTDLPGQALQAMAIERRQGKVIWQHKIADGIRRDRQSTFSASSPVTDGRRVIFFYSTGDLAAFDFAGNQLWSRNIQTDYGSFAFLWTFSSSPLLYGDKLYLQVLQRDVPVSGRGRTDGPNDSYLLAMDAATGKTLWRQVRATEAVAESHEAYATPVPFTYQGRTELAVIGGDCLTGHDPDTGKELWRWGTWNPGRIGHWRHVVTPVAGNGLILACAPKGAPVYAIKAGGSGVLSDSAIAWKSDQQKMITSDVPTPLFYDGDFFVLSDLRRNLSRVESSTGKIKWTLETPGRAKYEASPTGADGKIYLINFKGEVTIVNAESGALLRTIPMGEEDEDMIRSTIAVAHGQLFIRTNQKLFCVGRN
jgi:outer membrane protein assembly factor BamB